ncbi:MAG: DEAD/DEAH box helicase [Roseibacillus sp.]
MPSLTKPDSPLTSEQALENFLNYLIESGIEPYDHQENAILELFEGKNVILNTPTGSGKSLVAAALHYRGLCLGRTSYYTVPIKALANEKFLSLCQTFGPENVGLVTGDATVNPDAPIICCTAEILANMALRDGKLAPVDDVIIDEFHYYSDHSRGWAWQIPLLALPQCRFLLMSATIGDPEFFIKELNDLTGGETTLIQSEQRPVPLEFEYSTTTLEEKIGELAEANRAPIYLVHFTQLSTANTAQNLLSQNFCTKEEKKEIAAALIDADFRSPYGKEMARFLRHGVGIHHAGLLPKYRLLVEKLTQRGLLKVICGTDTLGVGVNVPIRTVVFTQMCKYDGKGTGILPVRDFKQIAGRAGRRGFDDIGYVVTQAPEHIIENLKLEAKAAAGKKKKIVKKTPPEKGYVHWDENTFNKLQSSAPEPLSSSFKVTLSLILHVLSRQTEDGCQALRDLIERSHETEAKKKRHRIQARKLFFNLVRGNILEIIPPAEREGLQKVRLNIDLQHDFSLNQALGLYLLDTIPKLDPEDPKHALNILSLIEAILEDPSQILRAQIRRAKNEAVAEMKEDGLNYDQRMEELEKIEHPKPGADFIYQTFNDYAAEHPYLGAENIRPKSIAREIYETYSSFEDYIKTYQLEKSEAILLRHLSEVYKVLSQTVPPALKTEELEAAEEHLETLVRQTDSSLLDEWEKLGSADLQSAPPNPTESSPSEKASTPPPPNPHQLIWTFLKAIAEHRYQDAANQLANTEEKKWDSVQLEDLFQEFFETHGYLRLDPEARNRKHLHNSEETFSQSLLDHDSQPVAIFSFRLVDKQLSLCGDETL